MSKTNTSRHVPKDVFQKTVKGATYFVVRNIILYPVSILGLVVLSRTLSPTDFGMYAAALFLVNIVSYFSDIGLSASLIQKKENPATRELQTVFTVQFFLVVVIVLGILFCSPVLFKSFKFEEENLKWLFPLVSTPLLFTPIRTISYALLSRASEFNKIAVFEFWGALIYQLLVIALAIAGFGVWSFAIANLVSRLYVTVACYKAWRWPVGFSCDWEALRISVSFGGIFQLSGMTSQLRDNIIPVLAIPLFGPTAAGYLKWSHNLASQFGQKFVHVISQVAFASFARLQDDPDALSKMANKILFYSNIFSTMILGTIAVLLPEIVKVIFQDKWQPAVFSFYFFSVAMVAGNFTTFLDNVIKGIGRVKVSLTIMTFWSILLWILCIALIQLFGADGIAIGVATAGVFAASWLVLSVESCGIRINLGYVFIKPIICGLLTVILLLEIKDHFAVDFLSLLALACIGFFCYVFCFWVLEGPSLVKDIKHDYLFFIKSHKPTSSQD